MTTITLELPDDLAARLAALLPEGERDRFAVAAIADALETCECVAAVEEALADRDAGRTISFEEEIARWQRQKAALLSGTRVPRKRRP